MDRCPRGLVAFLATLWRSCALPFGVVLGSIRSKRKKGRRKRTGLINYSQYLPVINSFPSFNRVIAVFCVRWEMLLNPFPQRKKSILETGFHVGVDCIDAFIHNYLGVSTSYHCPVVYF